MGLESRTVANAITEWQAAESGVKSLEKQLAGQREVSARAANKLVELLLPHDAQPREVFQMWVHDPSNNCDRILGVTCFSRPPGALSDKVELTGSVFWRPQFQD